MKIRTILVLLLLIQVMGCHPRPVYKYIRNSFTNRLGGKPTGIDSLLNTRGYYQFIVVPGVPNEDNFPTQMIFYDDGSFVYNFFCRRPLSGERDSCLNSVLKNGVVDEFYLGSLWGVYAVNEDTIKAQAISPSNSLMDAWGGLEFRFKILGKEKLQMLKYIRFRPKPRTVAQINEDDQYYKLTFDSFHPVDTLPPPYGFIKKLPWVWRNEKDWKAYMEELVRLIPKGKDHE